MSNDEIILLEQQLQELQRTQQELIQKLEEKKREEQLRAERERKVTVDVYAVQNERVYVRCPYRTDIIDFLRTFPGRNYHSHIGRDVNSIPFDSVDEFVSGISKLENVTVVFSDNLDKTIEEIKTKPTWEITKDERQLIFKSGPRAYSNTISKMPGADYQHTMKRWVAGLNEAWRIPEIFEREFNDPTKVMVVSDEVQALIADQLQKRATLDSIATLEDADLGDFEFPDPELQLKPFQKVGVKFADAAGGNCIIADEMGLGKTPQSIAYALYKGYQKVVIICPASLKPNWSREILKWTGENPYVLNGREPSHYTIAKLLAEPPRFVVINYDILRSKTEHILNQSEYGKEAVDRFLWSELLSAYKPDLVILDESHYIKNVDTAQSQSTRKIKSPRFITLTGTPVLNRPGELWASLTLVAPDLFPSYENFIHRYTDGRGGARNVEELRNMLKSLMIRRKKKDVMKDLPPINRIQHFYELSPRATKLYEKVLAGVYEAIAAYDSQGVGGGTQNITSILTLIMRLKQVCAIDKATNLTPDLATELSDSMNGDGNNKILIFTQFKATAAAIQQRLGQESLCFVERGENDFVTVDAGKRYELVDKFQNDPQYKYLVVTEKTTKEGMNITAAGAVIFNDLFWTPAAHHQAEARAYGRMSDPHSVNSYYLITDRGGKSIEEWIMELLGLKQDVINQVVEGIDDDRGSESVATALIDKLRNEMGWFKKK